MQTSMVDLQDQLHARPQPETVTGFQRGPAKGVRVPVHNDSPTLGPAPSGFGRTGPDRRADSNRRFVTPRTKPPQNFLSLPTQNDLPSEDNVPMETERHKKQMDLLINSLQPWLDQHQGGYVNGNMFVYYSTKQVRHQDFKGPDVFVVLGVGNEERKSWVVWEEGTGPSVVIELLSETTAAVDKKKKKRIYQTQLRVPEYFWFDPFNPSDWAGFRLLGGVYKKLKPNQDGLVCRSLGLTLIRWQGVYKNIDTTWLRWATLEGELLRLPEEAATQRAEAEAQRADLAEQRAGAEADARRAAEAEIARLKILLANK